jgi:hypothetical protein
MAVECVTVKKCLVNYSVYGSICEVDIPIKLQNWKKPACLHQILSFNWGKKWQENFKNIKSSFWTAYYGKNTCLWVAIKAPQGRDLSCRCQKLNTSISEHTKMKCGQSTGACPWKQTLPPNSCLTCWMKSRRYEHVLGLSKGKWKRLRRWSQMLR